MAPKTKRPTRAAGPDSRTATKETGAKIRSTGAPAGRFRKIDKSKLNGKRPGRKPKSKGWLATPADWARFDAWAEINARPRRAPEPPAMVRASKPLSQLKKRIRILSEPRAPPDPSVHCRLDFSISKAALNAVPSKRTILLSLPNVRLPDYGRVYYEISPAALAYQPSPRILELSEPRRPAPTEECEPARTSPGERRGVDEERLRKLALTKKLVACPQQLTPEEMEELFTPHGIRRSALAYRITPWTAYLSLPAYRAIKPRRDRTALTWKKTIIEEGEQRGKEALAEYRKREEGATRRGKKRRKSEDADEKQASTGTDADADAAKETEGAKRRKLEKHAWRFAPDPARRFSGGAKPAALKAEASPRTTELAVARDRRDLVCRPNAFAVRKAALSATASGRIEFLAKPSKPRSPVERTPPREKDKYGRPIFEMPPSERVLPKTKPYKMAECPPAKKKRAAKRRPIDPIAYEPTYDPCVDPFFARKQKAERKRAERLFPRRGRRRGRRRQETEATASATETEETRQDAGDAALEEEE